MATLTKSQVAAFNAHLFRESCLENTFANLLTDPSSKGMKGKTTNGQTSAHAPIIRVTDMEKGGGDEVEVDIFHRLTGKPTMGGRKLEGRGESMTQAHMKVGIYKGRHMVDVGDTFTQFKTTHDLKEIARNLLAGDDGYYGRLRDQRILYHLAGERGHMETDEDIIPLATDEEYAEIMGNPVLPPTYDRYMGGASNDLLEDLDSTDIFTMDVLENTRLRLDEMKTMRIPRIRFGADKLANANPLNLMLVSPRQFHDLVNSATGKDVQKMQVDAQMRAKGWDHPIFIGDIIFWRGILVRKMDRYVEFAAGKDVNVCANDNAATVSTAQASTTVHRALLIGGQALASVFGNVGKKDGGTSGFIGMHTEKTDHEESTEISIKWMTGEKKVRVKDKNGRMNDFGCMAIDTAVSA